MMFAPRDYRLAALVSLIKTNVVQKSEDSKLYLAEENLVDSKWKSY